MKISELALSPAAIGLAPIWGSERLPSGPSGLLMSIPAVGSQGTAASAVSTVSLTGIAQAANGAFEAIGLPAVTPFAGAEDGVGTGGRMVALRVVPRVRQDRALQLEPQGVRKPQGHRQPATNQHIYNCNPAVSGYVAAAAAGPPHRRDPV